VAFGISFKVKKWDPANDEDTMEVAGTSGFLGTSSNPIIVDEALVEDIKVKAKV
jgi:hypothetical protein